MNNGFFKCRINESFDAIVFTCSCSSSDFWIGTFKRESTHVKRQSRKRNALPNIKIDADVQRKHSVESDSQPFSITIWKIAYQTEPVSCAPEINDLENRS